MIKFAELFTSSFASASGSGENIILVVVPFAKQVVMRMTRKYGERIA